MPYINPDRRPQINAIADMEYCLPSRTAGELNYQLTVLIKQYFELNGKNYQAINDIVGALEGAKLEFYRRIAVPYEDQKIKENGDVYQV